jgi:hypothetical protein
MAFDVQWRVPSGRHFARLTSARGTFMMRTKLLSATLIVFAASCSPPSEPNLAESDSWPLTTTDPQSHPGFYDTAVVSIDENQKSTVVWQHTSAEQYASEVAAHEGHPWPDRRGGAIGTSSSAVISSVSCSDATANWLYNTPGCPAPDGSHVRLCLKNSGAAATYDLRQNFFYLCTPQYCFGPNVWAGNIASFWPGTQSGSFGGYYNILGYPPYQYIPGQMFNAGAPCTATDGTDQRATFLNQ